MSGRIGLLGVTGAVGGGALEALRGEAEISLRLGGRRPDAIHTLMANHGDERVEVVPVDVYEPSSLAAFADGCDVVVNCAGPSYRILDRVARPSIAAGAHYVDAGGDDPLAESLADLDLEARQLTALVTAGMMPGLSGLIPRLLAGRVDRATDLTAYVGVMDRLTPAGAVDYLLSLGSGHGESQAAWRDGRRLSGALTTQPDVIVPHFPRCVTAHPYLSSETERLACALQLDTVDWYNVFDGGSRMFAALARLQGAMTGASNVEDAARQLAEAADLDMFGRRPYQLMVYELAGMNDGAPVSSTAVLRSSDTSRLTGWVAGLAAIAILGGEVRPGIHFAAEALEPEPTLERLVAGPSVDSWEVLEGADLAMEDGSL